MARRESFVNELNTEKKIRVQKHLVCSLRLCFLRYWGRLHPISMSPQNIKEMWGETNLHPWGNSRISRCSMLSSFLNFTILSGEKYQGIPDNRNVWYFLFVKRKTKNGEKISQNSLINTKRLWIDNVPRYLSNKFLQYLSVIIIYINLQTSERELQRMLGKGKGLIFFCSLIAWGDFLLLVSIFLHGCPVFFQIRSGNSGELPSITTVCSTERTYTYVCIYWLFQRRLPSTYIINQHISYSTIIILQVQIHYQLIGSFIFFLL